MTCPLPQQSIHVSVCTGQIRRLEYVDVPLATPPTHTFEHHAENGLRPASAESDFIGVTYDSSQAKWYLRCWDPVQKKDLCSSIW